MPETSPEKEKIDDGTAQVSVPDFETCDDDEPTDEEKKTLRRGKNFLRL